MYEKKDINNINKASVATQIRLIEDFLIILNT